MCCRNVVAERRPIMKKVTASQLAKPLAWDQLFESDQELIDKMLQCNTGAGLVPRGYGYIRSFQRYYRATGELTPRQMTQLKRLAKYIYAYINGLDAPRLIVRIY